MSETMNTPVGTIYSTTALKDFVEMSSILTSQYLLTISDYTTGSGGKIKLEDFIKSFISADSGNTLAVGTDKLLISKTPNNVVYGATEYGGTIVTDLNTINKNGFYTCYGTANGAPNDSYDWFVVHQNSNVGTAAATQRAVAYNSTPIIYERIKISSTWGEWTAVGSSGANVDLSNLSAAGEARLGVKKFNNLGSTSSNQTLNADEITVASFTGSPTITLPTVTDTTKQVTCILDFTTATSGQPTITNSNIKWSDKNRGIAPSAYSTLTSVRNVITAKTIWIDSALYWELEYSTYGGVEATFTRPNLTANGTLGGNSFAVVASSYNASFPVYYAVDGSFAGANSWQAVNLSDCFYKIYNPQPLKVSSFKIYNYTTTPVHAITAGSVYGSNDDILYTLLTTYTNTVVTASANWDINIPEGNRSFYKYYKIGITNESNYPTYSMPMINELVITATYINA